MLLRGQVVITGPLCGTSGDDTRILRRNAVHPLKPRVQKVTHTHAFGCTRKLLGTYSRPSAQGRQLVQLLAQIGGAGLSCHTSALLGPAGADSLQPLSHDLLAPALHRTAPDHVPRLAKTGIIHALAVVLVVADGLSCRRTSLRKIWADSGYRGLLTDWVREMLPIILEIVARDPNQKGFQLLPRRWIVERTFARLGRYRRLSKDYEKCLRSSEGMIYIASIHTMMKRLAVAP